MPPAGFRYAGVAAGIKQAGSTRLDLGLVVADGLATAAGLFTRNRIKAAPVGLSQSRLRGGRLRGIVVNAGNANACTGPVGLRDAREMTEKTAGLVGARATTIAVASTGVIGVPLPMERVRPGIEQAVQALSPGRTGFDRFSQAMLTTDRGPKTASAEVGGARILGCAKGAGMIAPNLATTLAFVMTDAACEPRWLKRALSVEAAATFNAVSVDGDTSTNDSLFILASGARGGRTLASDDRPGRAFREALREVLLALAKALVRDGEGATKLVRIRVEGARSEADARAVARRVAGSSLVKTAFFGADPNWGRILCAVGNAGVRLVPERIELDFDDVAVVRRGMRLDGAETERRAHEVMSRSEYRVRIGLNQGRASAEFWTCDLGHEYVSINADYRS